MRLSKYFLPILKENPSEASIASHKLMLRSGMIRQLSSGLYNWLPFGLKVLQNISDIVRKGLNEVGCLELLMPCLQSDELWIESGRYDAYGKELLRIKDRHNRNLLFSPTNEEVITDIFRQNLHSYKNLPICLYQMQWKFRDEIRPRFGVMRAREFLMKDAYSFDVDKESSINSYNKMFNAYYNIFKKMGLNTIAVRADTGQIGGDLSHEFHVISETGESNIYYDSIYDKIISDDIFNLEKIKKIYAAADEMHDPAKCNVDEKMLVSKRGIEVGQIFYLGTKYSQALNAYVMNNKGEKILAEMGCYGIGLSRLCGAVIESNHDEYGIIWPKQIAPFLVSLINLKPNDEACKKFAENIYEILCEKKIEVLYDDNNESPGSKLATHDLIGIPWQLIISPKTISNHQVEMKNRRTMQKQLLSLEDAITNLMGTR